ncbi:MAG: hypothetical protein EF812_04800 [Methanosarcinales archaeon]|nr:MAG: hypothetical protein EF812_04800 [Methanosarcinales archaeon]
MKETPLKIFEISAIRGRLSKLFKTVGRVQHAWKSVHTQKRDRVLNQKSNLTGSFVIRELSVNSLPNL